MVLSSGGQTRTVHDLVVDTVDQFAQRNVKDNFSERTVEAFSLDANARPRQIELCGTICALLGAAHDKPLCKELLK